MTTIISAEHFDLDPAVRGKLEVMLEKLTHFDSHVSNIRLFLKMIGKQRYEATLVVHSNHKDISYKNEGREILGLVLDLKTHLIRRVINEKERRLVKRTRRARTNDVA